jgi:hypothetical protein
VIGNATGVDFLRVLVLLMGAGTVAVAVVVVAVYARSWWLVSHGPKIQWIGLLPAHVTLIGVSYLTMIFSTITRLVGRIHEPLTWRIPVYGVAYSTGLIAMWLILGHSRQRLRSITEEMHK